MVFDLFIKYKSEGGKGDKYIFINVLRVIVNLEDLDVGRKIYGFVEKVGLEKDIWILIIFIKMYLKCGSLCDVYSVFKNV